MSTETLKARAYDQIAELAVAAKMKITACGRQPRQRAGKPHTAPALFPWQSSPWLPPRLRQPQPRLTRAEASARLHEGPQTLRNPPKTVTSTILHWNHSSVVHRRQNHRPHTFPDAHP